MKKFGLMLSFALLNSLVTHAAFAVPETVQVSDRVITAVGGHNHHPDRNLGDPYDGIMEFSVDGAPIGSQFACPSNYVRFNMKEDTNANPMLSVILLAFATGKKVTFGAAGCATGRGVKLVWLTLSK